jgi:hypothetical protein
VAYQRDAAAVLSLWREIERALEKAAPGSAEFERLTDDALLLRDEYQRLVSEKVSHAPSGLAGLPEPGEIV